MAVSGILGDILYFLLVFFDKVFLKWFCCFSSIAFSPFYRVNLGSQGTIDSPVLLPVYQSLFCAHRPEGWAFRCFSFFLPFDVVSSKAMVDFSIPECAWCHVPYGSTFGRPSFFTAPCSGSPRYHSFALWEVTLGFLLFLAGSLIPEKDVSALCS